MANYLERVASSAGRRAAIAKPPHSGPPVLPAGRDFSLAADDPFAGEQDEFVDALETLAPARVEQRRETSTPKPEIGAQANPAETPPGLPAAVAPEPRMRPSHERLSSESPFTVHLPRTLRPISTAYIPPPVPGEPLRERTRVRTSTAGEEFTPREEPGVRSTDSDAKVTPELDTIAQTNPAVGPTEESSVPRATSTEAASDISPIPRGDGPERLTAHSAEPAPPPAVPVHLPAVTSSAARQEQSRISIGSLEVLVNNHPRVTPSRPAPAAPRSESLNLEKRYLDRFRLRH